MKCWKFSNIIIIFGLNNWLVDLKPNRKHRIGKEKVELQLRPSCLAIILNKSNKFVNLTDLTSVSMKIPFSNNYIFSICWNFKYYIEKNWIVLQYFKNY